MRLAYHVNEDEGLITLTMAGQLQHAQVYSLAKRLLGDKKFDPGFPQLVDLRGMDFSRCRFADPQSTSTFTKFLSTQYGTQCRSSIAIVVDAEIDADECAHVYWLSCLLENAELFENYEQSLRWLVNREFRKDLQESP